MTMAAAGASRYTGKERDAESGNDYFGARYYASSMGRFMSPDPLGSFVADVSNPQTWNMYAYALNNPLKFTDPTGYDCAYLNNSGDGIESLDQNSNSSECTQNGGYWADGAITNFQANSNGGYSFTSLDANLNTLYTNFNGSGNSSPSVTGDVMDYFMNYMQQARLQQNPSLWSMSPQQRIYQIALAQPTVCGGGAFAYGGRSLDVGPANGFAGGIVEADSNSGVSKGALFEAGGGEGVVGGGGYIVSNSGGGLGSSSFAYGGAGVELPGAHASVGEVGFSSGIGVYGDVSAGGREVGAGAYLNVTTNAGCMAAHK